MRSLVFIGPSSQVDCVEHPPAPVMDNPTAHSERRACAVASGWKLKHVDPNRRRGRVYVALVRFSTTKAGAWLSVHVLWKIDPLLLRLTKGRVSTTAPVAAGLLETVGARTGRTRRNPTLYFHDGARVTIVASLRGWPRHPAWYHNLRKHADVVFNGQPFRAEIVEEAAEQRRLWELADGVYPPYAVFRAEAAKAGRVIPIVQLIPREVRAPS
jgi:deazaflavin-dependent oxidoreductase (nitroreductase family)